MTTPMLSYLRRLFTKKTSKVKDEAGTYTLPIDLSAVTLGQYVLWHTAQSDQDRVCAAIGCTRKVAEMMKIETVNFIIETFTEVLATGKNRLDRVIDIGAHDKVGFIPDFNAMSLGEYVDLDTFAEAVFIKKDFTAYPKLMAVLFRPVTKQVGKYYEIRPYDSEKRSDYMPLLRNLPMDVVNGSLLFFSTTASVLQHSSLDYLRKQLIAANKRLKELEESDD